LLALALLIAIALLALDPAQLHKGASGPRVVAFVVDSSASMMDSERSFLQVFDDLTHGQVVSSILKRWGEPNRLYLHAVDNAYGQVDRERYLQALRQIEVYLRNNPNDRVVINISLGSYSPEPLERQLIGNLIDLGAIVVAAAGNQGSTVSVYPAALSGVICVGASDNGVCETYSNRGDIDIFAEGSYHIVQKGTMPWDTGIRTYARTITLNGTSFAAPRVSGLIVKMLRLKPSLETREILAILQATAEDVTGFGQGCINRLNALAAISNKYALVRKVRNAFFVFVEVICIAVLAGIGLLIVIPMPEFLFRVVFPSHWVMTKMRHIDKIMARKRKRARDFRYIIDCLLPGYPLLFSTARQALLTIGEPTVKHLVRAYPYKANDEFGDFKTCVCNLIKEIGGPQATVFLQSEQEGWCEDSEPLQGFEGV
jgi:hypothetical protein